MRRLRALVATLFILTLLWQTAPLAEATDRQPLTPNHSAPPPARTPSVLRGGDPGIERFDRDRRGHDRHGDDRRGDHRQWRHHPWPTAVFVAPSRCWQPGYWTHQWVPHTYTYNTWVAGHWSPDGRWIDGHYAPYNHHAGYWQPVWIEGYWASC